MPDLAITVNLVQQLVQPDPIQSGADLRFFGIGGIRRDGQH